jgi:hypothetical protein
MPAHTVLVLTRAALTSKASALLEHMGIQTVTWRGLKTIAAGKTPKSAPLMRESVSDKSNASAVRGWLADVRDGEIRGATGTFRLDAPYEPTGDQPVAIRSV